MKIIVDIYLTNVDTKDMKTTTNIKANQMNNRRQQSSEIKKTLKKNFPTASKLSVSAGQGTAWGWWTVGVVLKKNDDCLCQTLQRRCQSCSDLYSKSYKLAIQSVKDSKVQTSTFYADDGYSTKTDSINADIELI